MSTPLKKFFQYKNDKGKDYYYDTTSGKCTYKFPAEHCIFDPSDGKLIYAPPGARLSKSNPEQGEQDQSDPSPINFAHQEEEEPNNPGTSSISSHSPEEDELDNSKISPVIDLQQEDERDDSNISSVIPPQQEDESDNANISSVIDPQQEDESDNSNPSSVIEPEPQTDASEQSSAIALNPVAEFAFIIPRVEDPSEEEEAAISTSPAFPVAERTEAPAVVAQVEQTPAPPAVIPTEPTSVQPIVVSTESTPPPPIVVSTESTPPPPIVVSTESTPTPPIVVSTESTPPPPPPIVISTESTPPPPIVISTESTPPPPPPIVVSTESTPPPPPPSVVSRGQSSSTLVGGPKPIVVGPTAPIVVGPTAPIVVGPTAPIVVGPSGRFSNPPFSSTIGRASNSPTVRVGPAGSVSGSLSSPASLFATSPSPILVTPPSVAPIIVTPPKTSNVKSFASTPLVIMPRSPGPIIVQQPFFPQPEGSFTLGSSGNVPLSSAQFHGQPSLVHPEPFRVFGGDIPTTLGASIRSVTPTGNSIHRGASSSQVFDPAKLTSTIVSRQRIGTLAPSSSRSRGPGADSLDPSLFRTTTAASRRRQSTLTPVKPGGAAAQQAVKAPAVPLIARTFSAQEILHLAFGLEPTFTKANLLTALERYRLEDFAAACFRKHRIGSRIQGVISKKFIPPEELISFTTSPLKKPLLMSVRTELKQHSAYLFELLLEFSRIRPCHNEISCLRKILHVLRENPPELIDDFYFQLIKQTINNSKIEALLKTWELFLVVATIFPCSDDRYIWILAQIARATTDADQRIACVSTFIYIRFQTRHYIGKPLDYKSLDVHYLEQIPAHITRGKDVFGCSLYEIMWCQKPAYPKLVIPYVLHYMVNQLKERNCFHAEAIFRVSGNEGMVQTIRSEVNSTLEVISRGDVNVIASLLKMWLKELPNPVVPIELVEQFQQMCEQNKYLSFVEKLPQVHQLVLVYLIGFVKELAGSSQFTQMEKADLAMVFGPLIVNPVRSAKTDASRVQKLTELSVAFFNRLVDVRDTTGIYPLDPGYLPTVGVPTRSDAQSPISSSRSEAHIALTSLEGVNPCPPTRLQNTPAEQNPPAFQQSPAHVDQRQAVTSNEPPTSATQAQQEPTPEGERRRRGSSHGHKGRKHRTSSGNG